MKLNGWYRLWIVFALVWLAIVAGIAAPLVWDAPSGAEGDLIRSALVVWAVTTLAAGVLGYGVWWVLRGFQPRT